MTMFLAPVRFLTLRKDDLHDLARSLAQAIDPDFLTDAARPVIIGVGGDYYCGKKIIHDSIIQTLIPELRTCRGKEGHDEYRSGLNDGRDIEIHYMDCWYGQDSYSSPAINHAIIEEINAGVPLDNKSHRIKAFQAERRKGGIDVIQNLRETFGPAAGIHIEIMRKPSASIAGLVHQFAGQNDENWVRAVEIRIQDERLCHSPRFREFIHALRLPHPAMTAIYGKNIGPRLKL